MKPVCHLFLLHFPASTLRNLKGQDEKKQRLLLLYCRGGSLGRRRHTTETVIDGNWVAGSYRQQSARAAATSTQTHILTDLLSLSHPSDVTVIATAVDLIPV